MLGNCWIELHSNGSVRIEDMVVESYPSKLKIKSVELKMGIL